MHSTAAIGQADVFGEAAVEVVSFGMVEDRGLLEETTDHLSDMCGWKLGA